MSGARLALRVTLASVLLVVACLAAGSPPPAIRLAGGLELERLEDDLWLYRASIEMDGHPVGANGLVIGGPQGAIVIDTPWNDELTARLLDWAESSFGPIAAVIATHFHADRLGGIAEVRRRGIPSYGHAETARLAVATELPPPGSSFEDELLLTTGDRTVELLFPGPGHSPDNSVVWLPRERLLFGGCLVKSAAAKGLGNLGDAVVDGWPASLERLLARYPDARIVVPGHGAAGGLEAVRHTLDLVRRHLSEGRDDAGETAAGEPAGKAPAE